MKILIYLFLVFGIPFADRGTDRCDNLPVAKVTEVCPGVQWIDNMDALWGPWIPTPNGNERWCRCVIPAKTPYTHNGKRFVGIVYLQEIQQGASSLYLIGKSKDKMNVFGAGV